MHQTENPISIPMILLTLIYSLFCFAQDSPFSSATILPQSSSYDRPQSGRRICGHNCRGIQLYEFGLGKRSSDDGDDEGEYDEPSYIQEDERLPELELYQDDVMQSMDKRHKVNPFGQGKRMYRYDFGLGKRNQRPLYDFGLGKRIPQNQPPPYTDRMYNFGLGKRIHLYSFGLGKRSNNGNPSPGLFNFGLGKRSEDFDMSRNIIAKREVHEETSQEAAIQGIKPAKDSSQTSTSKSEKLSNPELESHEIMGHPGKQLSKRSPYMFPSTSRKGRNNSKSSKYLFNFGIGK